MYFQWIRADFHPPLHSLFTFFWFKIFPNNELFSRLPSFIIGVLIIPIAYLIVKNWFSYKNQIVLFSLLSSSHFIIYYSQAARSYIWLFLFSLIYTLFWLRLSALKEKFDFKKQVLFSVVHILLSYTHYFGLLLSFLLPVFFGLRLSNKKKVFIYLIVVNIFYIPGFFLLWKSIPLSITNVQPQESILGFIPKLLNFFLFNDKIALTVITFSTLVWILKKINYRKFISNGSNKNILYFLTFIVLVFIGISIFKPALQIRYLTIMLPILSLFLMILWGNLIESQMQLSWFLGICLVLQGVHFSYYHKYKKQEWDRASTYTLSNYKSGDKIYILGADTSSSAYDYLIKKDSFGFFYSRNLVFFRYYFEQINPIFDLSHLLPLDVRVNNTQIFSEHFNKNLNSTIYILAGHHLQIDSNWVESFNKLGISFKVQKFVSTKVYELYKEVP